MITLGRDAAQRLAGALAEAGDRLESIELSISAGVGWRALRVDGNMVAGGSRTLIVERENTGAAGDAAFRTWARRRPGGAVDLDRCGPEVVAKLRAEFEAER